MSLDGSITSVLSAEYIANVGFPIAAFTTVVLILVFLIRDCTKRNIECQNSKDSHIASFFKQSAESQAKHTEAINNISKDLKEIAEELRGISIKVDAYAKIIEKQFDLLNRR